MTPCELIVTVDEKEEIFWGEDGIRVALETPIGNGAYAETFVTKPRRLLMKPLLVRNLLTFFPGDSGRVHQEDSMRPGQALERVKSYNVLRVGRMKIEAKFVGITREGEPL